MLANLDLSFAHSVCLSGLVYAVLGVVCTLGNQRLYQLFLNRVSQVAQAGLKLMASLLPQSPMAGITGLSTMSHLWLFIPLSGLLFSPLPSINHRRPEAPS